MAVPETLIIIHYHFLPGGVCSAVKNSLVALNQTGWLAQRSLKVLTGQTGGLDEFVRFLDQWGIQSQVEVDARLDYSDRVWPDQDTFWDDASALATWFLQQSRGTSLYWAHNPTLGKNPLVTAGLMSAVQEVVSKGMPHQFLYHIHDFAECGRLQNLMYLRKCWGSGGLEDFYPASNNNGYAVLNSADFNRLIQVGVPKERIFLLPNAVVSAQAEKEKVRESIAVELQHYASDNGYRFAPERPWWTLPIRLIRRKNVVEALLLAAIAKEPPQLLVTLDANSEPERPYAEAVKALFKTEEHAAVVGFGHELVGSAFSFDDLLLASDVVVTTSLLEGFGFTFLEGANRGRPLVGRNLADVTSDFIEVGFPGPSLYDRFLVPADRTIREQMIVRGCQFAKKQGRLLGLSNSSIDKFGEEVKTIFSHEVVDFGFFTLGRQLDLTRRLGEKTFVQELKSLNPKGAEPIEFPQDFSERVEERYGLQAHANRLAAAFEGLFTQKAGEMTPANISNRLLDHYFIPRFHRPLIGDW